MALAIDPGRQSKAALIPRNVMLKLREKARRIKINSGLKHQLNVLPEALAIPDSAIANKATELAGSVCSPVIFSHVQRTFCFGTIVAARDGIKFDRELFYIAAVLHDLGLSDTHAQKPGSFEWVGAKEAQAFCLENGLGEKDAALVHDAIALHTSVGIAHKREPEIAMVHYGAGLDLMGLRLDQIPKNELATILERYPRDNFKNEFGSCLLHQADVKPNSHIAGNVPLGLVGRIKEDLE